MNKLQLMESVRLRRFMYDKYERDYRDTALKELAWAEIATECGAKDGNEAKREWKKIRDNFRDAVKRYNTKFFEKGKSLQNYIYFKEMSFLLPFVIVKNKDGATILEEEFQFQSWSPEADESYASGGAERNQEPEIEADELEEPPNKKCNSERSDTPLVPEKKFMVDPLLDTLRNAENQLEDRRTQGENSRTETCDHPVDIFFKAMAETTKRMPEKFQLLIKKKVFNLVHEYECDILENSKT